MEPTQQTCEALSSMLMEEINKLEAQHGEDFAVIVNIFHNLKGLLNVLDSVTDNEVVLELFAKEFARITSLITQRVGLAEKSGEIAAASDHLTAMASGVLQDMEQAARAITVPSNTTRH
jgi:hypothetical protein